MFLSELFESTQLRHAAFCFGRMNPPTVGHRQLIKTVAAAAQGGDYFIFTSQSHDAEKNPLDYQTKVEFLRALYPSIADHFVYNTNLRTIMHIAGWLYEQGYQTVTFVAGSDRLPDFKKLLTSYNGVEGKHSYYNFSQINFVSSGDRDADDEGIEGVSASTAREAARAGDMATFAQVTGAGRLAEPLYQAVRKGLLIEDGDGFPPTPNYKVGDLVMVRGYQGHGKIAYIKHRGDVGVIFNEPSHPRVVTTINDLYPVHNESLVPQIDECSGYIPKNKREAKDPRWSNALSVDVTPKTPTKNARAFRLI